MSTPKKILCGTDFSEPSLRAARAAAAIAAKLGEPLVLAHVGEYPVIVGGEFSEAVDLAFSQQANLAMMEKLKAEAARLRAETGAVVEEEFQTGAVSNVLAELAEKHHARMIIVASHKKAGILKYWLLGSTAERVVRHSSSPTLVLRDVEPLEKWLAGTYTLSIFIAADLAPSSDAALLWASDLAKVGQVEFIVGYANWIPDEAMRLGIESDLSLKRNLPEVQQLLERDIREKAERLLGDAPMIKIRVEPRWGNAADPLIEMAENSGADLLIAGTRQRWLRSSISRNLVHKAPMGVAIVPSSELVMEEAPTPAIRRILVPTDFSDMAHRAIQHAYDLLHEGGTICLAHVLDSDFDPSPEEIADRLKSAIPENAQSREIATEIAVKQNQNTAEGINQLAARFGADLICMGSHGDSALVKTLIGSVAREVVANSTCSVLIVR